MGVGGLRVYLFTCLYDFLPCFGMVRILYHGWMDMNYDLCLLLGLLLFWRVMDGGIDIQRGRDWCDI